MNPSSSREEQRKSPLLWLLMLVANYGLISGCSPGRLKPVNVDLARSTLIQTLDHWKSEGTIDELREGNPTIIVQEALWSNGKKLIDYTIIDDGDPADANWFCKVELLLESENGGEPTTKSVTYVVGTHPVLTVFHAIL